jgi:hypothetical protein
LNCCSHFPSFHFHSNPDPGRPCSAYLQCCGIAFVAIDLVDPLIHSPLR